MEKGKHLDKHFCKTNTEITTIALTVLTILAVHVMEIWVKATLKRETEATVSTNSRSTVDRLIGRPCQKSYSNNLSMVYALCGIENLHFFLIQNLQELNE